MKFLHNNPVTTALEYIHVAMFQLREHPHKSLAWMWGNWAKEKTPIYHYGSRTMYGTIEQRDDQNSRDHH